MNADKDLKYHETKASVEMELGASSNADFMPSVEDVENELERIITKSRSENSLRSTDSEPFEIKQEHRKVKVSFSHVDIRAYNRTVGEHPSVSSGPALDLAWSYEAEMTSTIDDYEQSRCGFRRYGKQLIVPRFERESILKNDFEVSLSSIANCVRTIRKVKFQRRQTLQNLKYARAEEYWQQFQRHIARFLKIRETAEKAEKAMMEEARAFHSKKPLSLKSLSTQLEIGYANTDDDDVMLHEKKKRTRNACKTKISFKPRLHIRQRSRPKKTDDPLDITRRFKKYNLDPDKESDQDEPEAKKSPDMCSHSIGRKIKDDIEEEDSMPEDSLSLSRHSSKHRLDLEKLVISTPRNTESASSPSKLPSEEYEQELGDDKTVSTEGSHLTESQRSFQSTPSISPIPEHNSIVALAIEG